MENKSYFTSQDASYSRTNVFTKTNVLIDLRGFLLRKTLLLRETPCGNFSLQEPIQVP